MWPFTKKKTNKSSGGSVQTGRTQETSSGDDFWVHYSFLDLFSSTDHTSDHSNHSSDHSYDSGDSGDCGSCDCGGSD